MGEKNNMGEKKTCPKGYWINIICSAVGIALCVYVWIYSAKFPSTNMVVGPSYFPRLLALGLLVFSLTLLINTVILKRDEEMEPFCVKNPDTQKMIAFFFATVVYCIIMKPIGFLPVTVLFIFGTSVLLGNRKWVSLAITSILYTGVVYWLFRSLLGIALPMGILKGIL